HEVAQRKLLPKDLGILFHIQPLRQQMRCQCSVANTLRGIWALGVASSNGAAAPALTTVFYSFTAGFRSTLRHRAGGLSALKPGHKARSKQGLRQQSCAILPSMPPPCRRGRAAFRG